MILNLWKKLVYRHYSRQIKESKMDLIIIDGGKGQLNAAIKSLNSFDINAESITFGLAVLNAYSRISLRRYYDK